MSIKWKSVMFPIFLAGALLFPIALVPATQHAYSEEVVANQDQYTIDIKRWGIYNDGTHAIETTKGINQALVWAAAKRIKATLLPKGTYLISKDDHVNMVSNMLFELSPDAVLQKEANGKERYELLYIGKGIEHVILRGGTYRGDKDKHDYSKKDNKYSAGTHENGYGILIEGASDVQIDGIKSTHFTGDGLAVGGSGQMIVDMYENSFISGSIDDHGKKINDKNKIRTSKALDFKNPIFQTSRTFELSNRKNLPQSFSVYFYNDQEIFLEKKSARIRDEIQIPEGADHFYLVFDQKTTKGAYFEYWNRVVSKDVVIKNSEFAFNRRQGVTVGGADNVLLINNVFHDMKGVAPQSGIDVEGGFGENGFLNRNMTIRNNEFYNNAVYDLILFDGIGATVEGNHFASKGVYGLAVSRPFSGARIINNHFDGSRLIAEDDATFIGNKMNDSIATIQGPNISIDGMEFTDSVLGVTPKVAFGTSISNVTITSTKKSDSGFSLWGKPIRVRNLTIIGEPKLRAITGGAEEGSIFENLKVIGFNTTYGLSLPPGTYTDCQFEGAEGGGKFGAIEAKLPGKYVFDGCTFKSSPISATNLVADHPQLDLTVKNSVFELQGNTTGVSVQSGKRLSILNNKFTALNLTSTTVNIIKVNDYWNRNDPFDVSNVNISGNKISTNLAAVGISTLYAGKGAPSYKVENNTLTKATLQLKANDNAKNNVLN